MALLEERIGVVTVVQPEGRIDSASAGAFGDRLSALVLGGATRLVIDLKSVAYLTSAGFRALLITAKQIDNAKGKLVLCGVNPDVMRLFQMGGFTEIFSIVGGREEAITHAGA